jgi:hypothetical protein
LRAEHSNRLTRNQHKHLCTPSKIFRNNILQVHHGLLWADKEGDNQIVDEVEEVEVEEVSIIINFTTVAIVASPATIYG